jgi:ABC-type transporter Mla MlaB component
MVAKKKKKVVAKKSTAKRAVVKKATAKKTTAKKSLIGVDPLAWLNEEDAQSDLNTPVSEGEADVVAAEEIQSEVKASSSASVAGSDNECFEIDLKTSITIRDVASLFERLKAVPPNTHSISFKCSEIERADAAALQLLALFNENSLTQGYQVKWDAPSDVLLSSAALLGLSELLHLSASH